MTGSTPVGAVLVGAGQRGHETFGRWAREHPQMLAFRAVVEPDAERRRRFADAHGIPVERSFDTLAALLRSGPLPPGSGAAPGSASGPRVAVVATPDRSHAHDAVTLLQAGFEVLLEKPLATSLEELRWLVREAGDALDRLQVVFELRFTTFYRSIHEIARSGRLGDVVNVVHAENLAPWFMAHSYVRGNWGSIERAAPAILAKCSHDLDLLAWNASSTVERVASFGSLLHFRPERAPAGSTLRCTDGCPVEDCLYDARRIYLAPDVPAWLVPVVSPDGTVGGLTDALRSGPYGRCVYRAGSDVVDHQVVAMELADGATITLLLNGHSFGPHSSSRTTRYDGTRATLRAALGPGASISIHDHDGRSETVAVPDPDDGHAGGDELMLEAFVDHIRTGTPLPTTARAAIEAHLLGFAAEASRSSGSIVEMAPLRASL